MPNCKLCLNREADKPNSHIIPKFLAKRLFESSKPRHSVEINRKGKIRKIQDTPKENFILCKNCEKRLEYLETLISRKITSINNYNNLNDKFKIKEYGKNKILECLNINPIGFKLFIFSIVWRTSVSSLPEFETFKLDDKTENELRLLLDKTLKNSHSELVNSISKTNDFTNFHYCVFKPLMRNEFSRGIFTAYKMAEFQFGIFTVDYIIFFYSNKKDMNPAFEFVSNFQNEKLLITLTGTDDWKMLNELVVRKMLKKQ
ncbi:hypothetical protein [Tenacibaculum sp. A30]|uniref:hypothetical protein n=1 Tax=Tenacibaculum sp. A30 TaxID=3442644 RepID=UPI003EB9EDD2